MSNAIANTQLTITPSQGFEFLTTALDAGLVPYLHGSPAIGKSALAQQVAAAGNLELIDIRLSQCDPTDLNGFPTTKDSKATYIPMDTFPLKGDTVPAGKNGWLLFFDELPAATRAVQAAA